MNPITIRARNFRGLEHFEWSPTGVCLLSGPNGAGKTTTLDVLRFLRALFTQGVEQALLAVGGDYFRFRDADAEALVEFEVEVGEIRWVIRLPMHDSGRAGRFGEVLWQGHEVVFKAEVFGDGWQIRNGPPMPFDDTRCCAKLLWDRGQDAWMEPLVRAMTDIRVYESFWLNKVRDASPREEGVGFLHGTGRNVWGVLAAWKQAPRIYKGQFDWVVKHMRLAFPDVFESLEFDKEPLVYAPGVTDPAGALPARRQADGVLTGLLLLTAVAGAKPDSVVAIDEMENQLHPHAIRAIIEAMREKSRQHNLTIVLTTHSPVVMNEFKGREGNFYVLERSEGKAIPIALDEARAAAWLSHFALGDLYEREKFSAPGVGGQSGSPVEEP